MTARQAGTAKRFRTHIENELAELRRQSGATVQDRAPVALDQQSVGRLSRMDAMQGQAMAAAADRRRRARIVALEAALTRMANDEFGYCEDCGEAIPPGRLEIDPAARFCVSCAAAGGN
ncbi:MAG TPA: TraR/DksA C4-type zinc finger protein [Devosiaceae bacterium]